MTERETQLEQAAEHWHKRMTDLQLAVRHSCYDLRMECGLLKATAEAGERMASENAIDAARRIMELIDELRRRAD